MLFLAPPYPTAAQVMDNNQLGRPINQESCRFCYQGLLPVTSWNLNLLISLLHPPLCRDYRLLWTREGVPSAWWEAGTNRACHQMQCLGLAGASGLQRRPWWGRRGGEEVRKATKLPLLLIVKGRRGSWTFSLSRRCPARMIQEWPAV